MMYREFLEISGEDYNVTTGEMYMYEIEPVYQCSPESMFKDKRDFINWWKNNKELCKWMSSILRMKDNMKKDMDGMMKQKVTLEEKILELEIKLNGMKQDVEEKEHYTKEIEKSMEDALYTMQLRIAFAPDKTMNEMRLLFFPNYEEVKKDAVEKGIIEEN